MAGPVCKASDALAPNENLRHRALAGDLSELDAPGVPVVQRVELDHLLAPAT
jgi:hypothetical protein